MNQFAVAEIVKTLEQERCARRQAEAENTAKDEFFAFFLHELKNPLNTLHGWSQLLSRGRLDQAQTSKALETINRNTDFLNELIQDLLDVSRIVNGKMEVKFLKVNLRQIIEDALEDCLPTADCRNIALVGSFERADCHILGDAKRLRQIIGNLLNNSIKFTPSGGFISIDLRQTTSFAEIVFKDSGIGIKPEFLPHVFERFRQADEENKPCQNNGLGLGLAVVRHLVELHDGSVEVDSNGAGKGTTFTVKFPL